MSEIIRDGAGGSNSARVGNDNRLWVSSKSRPSEEVDAEDGRSFIFHGECHTAAASSGGLMYFTNTDSNNDIVITRVYIDSHIITTTDLIFVQVKKPTTITSGTDISTTGIIQKNYGSGISINGTLIMSDSSSDMTYTGGTNYHAVPVPTMNSQVRELKGTNVITSNTTILWGWKTRGGGNAVDGEIISLSVNCFKRSV